MLLKEGQRVLFLGDSVTDAGRDREDFFGLGNGYPAIISGFVGAAYPGLKNRVSKQGCRRR
ncbi:MAG: Lysophospholipase L1-like esterase [Mesotoga prima]|uniref:Lysophospholipase L1-like esterase n=1 Tax=Mesotoga prima TaxID=1184387 RepID=A0A124FY47_9BACT|nr:MAG: Lysophospholipase L1-like esterase [Mesotoga prima]